MTNNIIKRSLSFDEAKQRFPNRFTMEHVPQWANKPRADGSFYAPQYSTDAEWYENTLFPGEGGIHPRAIHCRSSNRSWPMGEKLSLPFRPINSTVTKG